MIMLLLFIGQQIMYSKGAISTPVKSRVTDADKDSAENTDMLI